MDPKVLNFLYLNGFVVLVLVAYLIWRPKKGPSRLKLRESRPSDKLDYKSVPQNETRKERQLTVIFQFNGHDFEAYEVLGLAAGSSLETVEKCYAVLIQSSSSDSHEFFRMAFNAIKQK